METGFAGDVSVALAIIKVGRKIDNENLTAAELTTCLHRKKTPDSFSTGQTLFEQEKSNLGTS